MGTVAAMVDEEVRMAAAITGLVIADLQNPRLGLGLGFAPQWPLWRDLGLGLQCFDPCFFPAATVPFLHLSFPLSLVSSTSITTPTPHSNPSASIFGPQPFDILANAQVFTNRSPGRIFEVRVMFRGLGA